jgi:hypothetical protein
MFTAAANAALLVTQVPIAPTYLGLARLVIFGRRSLRHSRAVGAARRRHLCAVANAVPPPRNLSNSSAPRSTTNCVKASDERAGAVREGGVAGRIRLRQRHALGGLAIEGHRVVDGLVCEESPQGVIRSATGP